MKVYAIWLYSSFYTGVINLGLIEEADVKKFVGEIRAKGLKYLNAQVYYFHVDLAAAEREAAASHEKFPEVLEVLGFWLNNLGDINVLELTRAALIGPDERKKKALEGIRILSEMSLERLRQQYRPSDDE